MVGAALRVQCSQRSPEDGGILVEQHIVAGTPQARFIGPHCEQLYREHAFASRPQKATFACKWL
jgi:hypothetical protein